MRLRSSWYVSPAQRLLGTQKNKNPIRRMFLKFGTSILCKQQTLKRQFLSLNFLAVFSSASSRLAMQLRPLFSFHFVVNESRQQESKGSKSLWSCYVILKHLDLEREKNRNQFHFLAAWSNALLRLRYGNVKGRPSVRAVGTTPKLLEGVFRSILFRTQGTA